MTRVSLEDTEKNSDESPGRKAGFLIGEDTIMRTQLPDADRLPAGRVKHGSGNLGSGKTTCALLLLVNRTCFGYNYFNQAGLPAALQPGSREEGSRTQNGGYFDEA